jgi:hypothetical protein
MHLFKKGFVEKYLCWFAYREPYIPHVTMLEKIIYSTFSSSNIHEFVDDYSNPYRSIVMDAIKIKHGYSSKNSRNIPLNEEPNVDATRFFEFLKDYDELLWDWYTTHRKVSVIARVISLLYYMKNNKTFTLILNHGKTSCFFLLLLLSEVLSRSS